MLVIKMLMFFHIKVSDIDSYHGRVAAYGAMGLSDQIPIVDPLSYFSFETRAPYLV